MSDLDLDYAYDRESDPQTDTCNKYRVSGVDPNHRVKVHAGQGDNRTPVSTERVAGAEPQWSSDRVREDAIYFDITHSQKDTPFDIEIESKSDGKRVGRLDAVVHDGVTWIADETGECRGMGNGFRRP